MLNALTIDVEDYRAILQRDWLNVPGAKPTDAVLKNTRWYLKTFNEYKVKATFFILGEVAQCFPQLVKEIAELGHEIAVHGFSHKQIFKLNREEFKTEVGDAKKLLEDISGLQVMGHRAPAFSINKDTQWALEVLVELGYKYDSSVYPISGKRYGWPGFNRGICKVDLPSGNSIIEVPMSTINVLGKTLPAAGGGYIRHFPYFVSKLTITQIQKIRPTIIYMHPYGIDIENKKFDLSSLSFGQKFKTIKFHLLQLRNRKTVSGKLVKLLQEFKFTTLSEVIDKTFEK